MARIPEKLNRSFYARPTLEVAPDLLGKFIIYHSPDGRLTARITEVEAYIGKDDPACHAHRGCTPRNTVMFGPPGYSYIYFIYGMHYCINFVTEPEGVPAAVLLRAADPVEGIDHMRLRMPARKDHQLLNGPGKFCKAFTLTRDQNGLDLTGNTLYLEDRNSLVTDIGTSPRIGIRSATDRPWRFFDKQAVSVSK